MNPNSLPQVMQHVQQHHRINAAGYGDNDAVTGFNHLISTDLFQDSFVELVLKT